MLTATCNNYGSVLYVIHVISRTRLPLSYNVEKIGEPGDEAMLLVSWVMHPLI